MTQHIGPRMGTEAQSLGRVTLPPLPFVAHEVLLATLDDRVDAEGLAERLRTEPGLAARVLAVANTAWFSGRAPVNDLRDAVVRLGIARLRALTTGLLIAPVFDTARCPAFEPARFWRQAVATGFAAGQLAREPTGSAEPACAAMAGLLRNIGLLLLAHALPRESDEALRARREYSDVTLAGHFRQTVGVSPADASTMLLRAWELPEGLTDAVTHSYGTHRGNSTAAVVRAAHEWAQAEFEPDFVAEGGLPEAAFARCAHVCRSEWERMDGMAQLLASP